MDWFNYYGLAIMAVIMIPNIIYAIKHKNGFVNMYQNRVVVILELIGRFACFVLMIFNIPYTYFNFWFDYALYIYLSVNGILCALYIIFWILCWNRDGKLKAFSLSIIPSTIFLFSGIVLASIPLIIFAVVFGVCHILISYRNAQCGRGKKQTVNEKLKDEVIVLFLILLVVCVVISLFWNLLN